MCLFVRNKDKYNVNSPKDDDRALLRDAFYVRQIK